MQLGPCTESLDLCQNPTQFESNHVISSRPDNRTYIKQIGLGASFEKKLYNSTMASFGSKVQRRLCDRSRQSHNTYNAVQGAADVYIPSVDIESHRPIHQGRA